MVGCCHALVHGATDMDDVDETLMDFNDITIDDIRPRPSSWPFLASNDQDTSDLQSWTRIHPEHWCAQDVLHWMYHCISLRQVDNFRIRGENFTNETGADLVKFTRDEFEARDSQFGGYLYDCLQQLKTEATFQPPVSEGPNSIQSTDELAQSLSQSELSNFSFVDMESIPTSCASDQHDDISSVCTEPDSEQSSDARLISSINSLATESYTTLSSATSPQASLSGASFSGSLENLHVGPDDFLDLTDTFGTIHLESTDLSPLSPVSSTFMYPSEEYTPASLHPEAYHPYPSTMVAPPTHVAFSGLHGYPPPTTYMPVQGGYTNPVEGNPALLRPKGYTPYSRIPRPEGVGPRPRRGRRSPPHKDGTGDAPRKRQPYRTRIPLLWEFLRDLLKSGEEELDRLIRWEDHEQGVFKIVNTEEVAQRWGRLKKRPHMNYANFSRALRFGKTQGFFAELPKDENFPKKKCFKFGHKTHGWS